jgi:hypothetical protein
MKSILVDAHSHPSLPHTHSRPTSSRSALAIGIGMALCMATAHAQRFTINPDTFTFKASGPTPFTLGCSGVPDTGTLYPNAEVEPFASVNPRFPLNLIGVWQQDRWSNGGSRGLGTGYSFDGGVTWKRVFPPFSRCAGGNDANNGNYERATDPWVSFSPNGVAHQMALSFDDTITPGKPASAMLASRSTDGGRSWSKSIVLVADTEERFNDKNAMTADPTDSRYVYAVWDRLSFVPGEGAGPILFARSVDNGVSWEPTRIIYDPGLTTQTIGARIEVLPNGDLVNLFTQIDLNTNANILYVLLSKDKGTTWSAPIKVADAITFGAKDPETGAAIRDGSTLAQLAIDSKGVITVVWQDARFSPGNTLEGIVVSQSSDGGNTWSAPVQINRDPLVQAFLPSIHVRKDGTIGVTYYDLRSNTADPATLPTDVWLTRSRDGVTWRESRISKPFDMAKAPEARGLFVGDYQGLVSIGPLFIPFFVKTTDDGTANRNDVYSHFALGSVLRGAASGAASVTRQVEEEEANMPALAVQGTGRAAPAMTDEMRQRSKDNIERIMSARVPNWKQRMGQRMAQ